MNKCELLKKLHKILGGDDYLSQDALFEAQHIIDQELWREKMLGNVELKQLSNGFIKSVKIVKKKPLPPAEITETKPLEWEE